MIAHALQLARQLQGCDDNGQLRQRHLILALEACEHDVASVQTCGQHHPASHILG